MFDAAPTKQLFVFGCVFLKKTTIFNDLQFPNVA